MKNNIIILDSTQAETALQFCDSWHIVSVEIYGYLHDVGYKFCIRGIEADEIGTTPSQLKKLKNMCLTVGKYVITIMHILINNIKRSDTQ